MRMQFATGPDPTDLLMLPWSTPLAEWPKEDLVSLPRGISRHVVRFVRIGGIVYAIKEISQGLAEHEYEQLRELAKSGIPVVQAIGVVANRMTPEGEPLDAALVTKHLRFSLPYRALFSRRMDPHLETKLLDALAELLVRLHLVGFAWKDCSLSNTLFRRDAGALAAYLVDAETGEMRESLSKGQRLQDLDIVETNVAGELLDLQMSGLLSENVDPLETAISVIERYERLWEAVDRTPDHGRGRVVADRATAAQAERTGVRRRTDPDQREGRRPAGHGADPGGRRRTSSPAVVLAHRHRCPGEPGPSHPQRHGHLPFTGCHAADRGRRGHRRAPLRHRCVRPGTRGGAARTGREARAGRGFPRGAGAPVVPLAGRRA